MSHSTSATNPKLPFTARPEGAAYGYFSNTFLEGAEKNERVQLKLQNIVRILGYIPGIGTIVGFIELVLAAKEIKICNEKLNKSENLSEEAKENLQNERTYQISRLIRNIFTTFSLGIVFFIPDLVVTHDRSILGQLSSYQRQTAEANRMRTNHLRKSHQK